MQQRAMIAMALACQPRLLVADEPTTALDVTIQAQILELLAELQRQMRMAVLLITHNFGLVASFARRVNVMYAGVIVEAGPVQRVLSAPAHPYTQALMRAVPRLRRPREIPDEVRGSAPDLSRPPAGCRFHPRCPKAQAACRSAEPRVEAVGEEHTVRCHFWK